MEYEAFSIVALSVLPASFFHLTWLLLGLERPLLWKKAFRNDAHGPELCFPVARGPSPQRSLKSRTPTSLLKPSLPSPTFLAVTKTRNICGSVTTQQLTCSVRLCDLSSHSITGNICPSTGSCGAHLPFRSHRPLQQGVEARPPRLTWPICLSTKRPHAHLQRWWIKTYFAGTMRYGPLRRLEFYIRNARRFSRQELTWKTKTRGRPYFKLWPMLVLCSSHVVSGKRIPAHGTKPLQNHSSAGRLTLKGLLGYKTLVFDDWLIF